MIAKVRPAIRLRPAPALDPPFDDETTPQLWDHQLPLQFDGAVRQRRHAPIPVPRIRSGVPAVPDGGAADTGPPPAAALASASAEARQAARRFLDVCLEILNGYRPVGHIRTLTGYNSSVVVEQMAACLDRADGLRRARDPGRPSRPNEKSFVLLRHLRVCEPRPGVAEGAAAIALFERTWALAFRLERKRGRWLCATVRLV